MPWTVHATPPSKLANYGWDFREGYFPRTYHYKREAVKRAQEAIAKGATEVKIERSQVNTPLGDSRV